MSRLPVFLQDHQNCWKPVHDPESRPLHALGQRWIYHLGQIWDTGTKHSNTPTPRHPAPDVMIAQSIMFAACSCRRRSVKCCNEQGPKSNIVWHAWKWTQDFPKVYDPTILEFMATFSAWIRVTNHRVLRCGSLQNKCYKICETKSLNCCT